MSNRVSEYYFNEIDGWKSSIDYYVNQIDQEIKWMEDIVGLNTIPRLASSVNHFIQKFQEKRDAWKRYKSLCGECAAVICDEDSGECIDDDLLTEDIVMKQREMRDMMKNMERDYLDLKYAGDEFVADTLIVHRQK